LQTLAARLRASEVYARAQARLRSASPQTIAVARLLPGIRPYATLISGAAGGDIRTFLIGALPALLLWELFWILVGMLVGLPAAHLLGRFERIALRGVILVALGAVAWLAIRNVSSERREGIARVGPRFRASLALAVDSGIVVCVVVGLFAIGCRVVQVTVNGWIELLVAAVLLMVLLVVGRSIKTPGETLLDTHYWHHSSAARRQ
jgi:hypothetical protein